MQENCGIYKITINELTYYGSSINLKRRRKDHSRNLQKNKHFNYKLQKAYNISNDFKFEIIQLCSPEQLLDLEQKFINTIWNKSECANLKPKSDFNMLGFKHSEKTKKEISLIVKNQMSCPERREINRKSQLGKIMSDETKDKIKKSSTGRKKSKDECDKISKAHQGKVISQEIKNKISETLTGRKLSEEVIRKMSLSRKGKPLSQKNKDALSLSKTKNSIVLIFETREETFFSLKQASERINVKIHTLNAWLDGKNPWPQKQSLQNPYINGLIGGYKIKKINNE